MEDKQPKNLEPVPAKPQHSDGADSQLRCYNASEWRLEDWFDDEKPAPPAAPQREK